jgi:hypothetical protein
MSIVIGINNAEYLGGVAATNFVQGSNLTRSTQLADTTALDNVNTSGFYTVAVAFTIDGNNDYYHIWHVQGTGADYSVQFATKFGTTGASTGPLYKRSQLNGGTWTAWEMIPIQTTGTWVPANIYPSSGAWGTAPTVNSARYVKTGNIVSLFIDFTLGTIGSATGDILVIGPYTAKVGMENYTGTGRDNGVTGLPLFVTMNGNSAIFAIKKWDTTTVITPGVRLSAQITVEVA